MSRRRGGGATPALLGAWLLAAARGATPACPLESASLKDGDEPMTHRRHAAPSPHLDNCTWYSEMSCCTPEDTTRISHAPPPISLHGTSRACRDELHLLQCAACSPAQADLFLQACAGPPAPNTPPAHPYSRHRCCCRRRSADSSSPSFASARRSAAAFIASAPLHSSPRRTRESTSLSTTASLCAMAWGCARCRHPLMPSRSQRAQGRGPRSRAPLRRSARQRCGPRRARGGRGAHRAAASAADARSPTGPAPLDGGSSRSSCYMRTGRTATPAASGSQIRYVPVIKYSV